MNISETRPGEFQQRMKISYAGDFCQALKWPDMREGRRPPGYLGRIILYGPINRVLILAAEC